MILPGRELMPVIRAALARGQRVRMTVTGSSMLPFLRDSDVVELEPAPAPRLGDMVLVQTDPPGAAERYVLHRIVRMDGGAAFFIRGDAQPYCEGPFKPDAVLGRVATVRRNGRARALGRGLWRLAGLVWIRCTPFGLWLLWMAARIRGIGGRVVRGLQRMPVFRAQVKRFRPAYIIDVEETVGLSQPQARRQAQERSPIHQCTPPILLTCLGYAGAAAKAERLARVPAEEWRRVVESARQHSVTLLLYHHLKPLDLALPGDMADELKQEHLKQALRNIRLYQELSRLLLLLQEKNIAVIVLKGAYLAEAVYDNIGLRSMSDVDLLVKKDDLLRVEQELLALGGVPEDCNRVIAQDKFHFGYKLLKSGLRVEIHWALNSSYPLQIDVEGLWSRAQPVTLAQAPAWALSPEDLLLHLCLHTAIHAYDMRVRMLCDIGEVVRRNGAGLDWQGIGARARQWGILRAAYVILRLAQELLEAAVPADWLASVQPAGFDERNLALARERILAARADGIMAQSAQAARLWGTKGLGGKIALIRDRLLLSRESMAIMYPAPANSCRIYLYYPVRLKDVLMRHGGMLWRLARGDSKTRAAAERTNEVTGLRDWLMSG